jgi:hypothetical protein
LFSLGAQNTLLHAFLAFKVSVEKSAIILMGLPLYVIRFFSLIAFNILSPTQARPAPHPAPSLPGRDELFSLFICPPVLST